MSSTNLPTARQFVTRLLDSLPSSSTDDVGSTAPTTNPLQSVNEDVKKQLLALQVLFPNEFVPALDLLDRRLVTRLRICDDGNDNASMQSRQAIPIPTPTPIQQDDTIHANTKPNENNTQPNPPTTTATTTTSETTPQTHPHPPSSQNSIYYVRSAQQRPSRFATTSFDNTTSYEVRLTAWNCSCPAFAFSAFPASHNPSSPPHPCTTLTSLNTPSTETEDKRSAQVQQNPWIFGGVSRGDDMPPVCKHLLACVFVERCVGLFGGFVVDKDVSVEEAAGWAAGWGD
ncbi:hypothetical protein NX059_001734 [Plenodomus lindquistii]|nr:hypothetical protein NX059_001734 [Plenodomus lindquistii]